MKQLKVKNVNYLNGEPYRSLSKAEMPQIAYLESDPHKCAQELFEGEVDLALVPTAEFLSHGDLSYLKYGIVSKGAVGSVLFFYTGKITDLKSIIVDGHSNTSVNLLKIYLNKRYQILNSLKFYKSDFSGSDKSFLEQESVDNLIQNISSNNTGALIIGDKALNFASKVKNETDLKVIDLGLAWAELSGEITGKIEGEELPFVFAIWAYNRELLSKEFSNLDEILSSIEKNFQESLAKREELCDPQLKKYVTEFIHYEISEKELKGLELYHRLGIEAGIFPANCSSVYLKADNIPDQVASDTSLKKSDRILQEVEQGKRLSLSDAIYLAENAELDQLQKVADQIRKKLHPENVVTYIVDRNINYTNICNVYCRFCAFYSPHTGDQTGKPKGYTLSKEEIAKKIEEILPYGGVQILLQGGLNPDLKIEWYEELFSWLKNKYPMINLHALSADEVGHIAEISGISIQETFKRLIGSGLGSLPGAGGEILVDRVRRRIARNKTSSETWLNIHRLAHMAGITSTVTMMFGVDETWRDRINHLYKVRKLQDETGGFTAFIAWPFQPENTNLKISKKSDADEYLRVQAISRIFLDNIENIQSSWVTMGPEIGKVALSYGANDYGSVMFEENVVSAAGTTFAMSKETMEESIISRGFYPKQRDVHYNILN